MSQIAYGDKIRLGQVFELIDQLEAKKTLKIGWGEPKKRAIRTSYECVQKLAKENEPYYGINTGFGALSEIKIPASDVRKLQTNIVRSHAAGVGNPLPWVEAALLVFLRIHCLSQGYSGVRLEILQRLNKLLSLGWVPSVPEQGSVGACGDLAPLAHVALVLLGEGTLIHANGKTEKTSSILRQKGLKPMQLEAKEGLSLVNGTQVSLAIMLIAYYKALRLISRATQIAAMSLDGFMGSTHPFRADLVMLRRHPGVAIASHAIRRLLKKSQIAASHQTNCSKLQDPYSYRCAAQILGSALDTFSFVGQVLEREVNAVTDNPIVLTHTVISNGNFHGQAISAAADYARIAFAEVGSISERRFNKLLDDHFNQDVPKFLTPNPGLESGLMMAQVSAAALVSENKTLAHPQSIDSIPTNLEKEDHVSMSTTSGRFLRQLVSNVETILACECLGAFRALHLRRPRKSGEGIERLYEELKKVVSPIGKEIPPAQEIEAVRQWFWTSKGLQAFEKDFIKKALR